jgi:DNA-binding NarL/FixJ family response regulator
MNILLVFNSYLIAEALCDILRKAMDGNHIHVSGNKDTGSFKPDIIISDIGNIDHEILSRYHKAKVLLLDTGLKHPDIIATLLSYRIHGVLSLNTDLHLLKKAIKVVTEGEIWIDNKTIKEFLHNTGLMSKPDRIAGLTEKEKMIVTHVCQGCRNKDIASNLSMSEQTVKVHLNRIFRKFNVSSRSQLVALTLNNNQLH